MKKKLIFCEECRDDVTYTVKDIQLEANLKGEKYNYAGKIAHCAYCDSEVYVSEINDSNLKALYDEYRQQNEIISLEDILSIPDKYAIGKRPLSTLLGWGEQTFSRYCDGDMPTKQYSEILQHIYNDPNYYAEILEKNKSNLKSDLSYKKSKRAVDILLGTVSNNQPKIDLAVEYLIHQCKDITQLAIQKSLYYIQGFHHAFYGTFMFNENCEAWVHGPVYRDVYYRNQNYYFDSIEETDEFDVSVFSSSEKAILDSAIKNICCYSGSILETFTHTETPWLITRGDLPIYAGSNKTIDKKLIGDYFSAVKEKYKMISPADIKEYTQRMFEQI